ncbi:MAG: IS3 family transposase [Acutalibacteraceae bacterium]
MGGKERCFCRRYEQHKQRSSGYISRAPAAANRLRAPGKDCALESVVLLARGLLCLPSIAKFITAWIRRCAAENFFSILKIVIYRTKLKTYEEARLLIGEYIHFYNHERIKLKISCKKE